jgi:uncharacterized protein (UPF0212 family)
MNPEEQNSNKVQMKNSITAEYSASVHCPMCTHTVHATVSAHGRSVRVKPGQKCPRCSSSLDAAYVLRLDRAA